MSRPTYAERFWAKVDKAGPVPEYAPHLGPCWLWTASLDADGYGRFQGARRGSTTGAHRVAYELVIGSIPDGLELDHLCRVKCCIRPSHLEAVTRRVNTLRSNNMAGMNSRKTKCKRDHPFDAENTSWTKDGRRVCRDVPSGADKRSDARLPGTSWCDPQGADSSEPARFLSPRNDGLTPPQRG